jgi:hypothetical protein
MPNEYYGWLTSLWQFFSRINFVITVKDQWLPLFQRNQDVMLLDFFVSLKYKPKGLKILNQCRHYLQAISLTDITSADYHA